MITRVYGKVDGSDVILQQQSGDRWTVPVPLDKDGEYIVEIIAEDEACNQSYMAKMLFIVNKALIRCYAIPLPYYATLFTDKTAYLIDSPNTAELQRFYAEYIKDNLYTAEILKGA